MRKTSLVAETRNTLRRIVWRILGPDRHPYQKAREDIFRYCDQQVLTGPFAGQRFPSLPKNVLAPAMAVGCYESELHELVEALIAQKYETFVDVGASHGYYAIGMAMRCPELEVIAFEGDEIMRACLLKAAELNGVSRRVSVRGYCGIPELNVALGKPGRTIVLLDVEGAEYELADPLAVPRLQEVDVIIEEHELAANCPGLVDTIRKRFEPTHTVDVIPMRRFTLDDVPLENATKFHVQCLNWRMPGQTFLWLKSREQSG